MYENQRKGKIGENLVCQYLKKRNYLILERNFRSYKGEIDVIAWDTKQKELVFIEVKTRSNLKYGNPAEAVTKNKKHHILEVAKYYCYKNKMTEIPIRLDIIEVYLNNSNYKINHIKKAFYNN